MIDNYPLVSVVVNCYNGEKYLREAIDSVCRQTYENWEIVFWDNASLDSSAYIAKSYGEKLKYFASRTTIPLYAARNCAIEKCKGEYIAFLDCDDVWLPEKLEMQVQRVLDGADVVYTGYTLIDENGEFISGSDVIGVDKMGTNDLFRMNQISMSSVLIDKNVFKMTSFNSEFNLIGDFDLWVRLSFQYRFSGISDVLQYSRKHSESTSVKMSSMWCVERRKMYSPLIKLLYFVKYPWFFLYVVKNEIKILMYRFYWEVR